MFKANQGKPDDLVVYHPDINPLRDAANVKAHRTRQLETKSTFQVFKRNMFKKK